MLFLRLLVLLLAVMSVVFVCVYLYLLADRREKFAAEYPDAASDVERERFVEARVQVFAARLRPRLALLCYGLPTVLLAFYIWVSN